MSSLNDMITLTILTVNGKSEAFDLELAPSLSVYDLKQKITLTHPTKPKPQDQRLVFSGKLLDNDDSLLNQIFTKSSARSSFTIHLVLDSDKNASTPKIPKPTTVHSNSVVREQPSSPPVENPPSSSHSHAYEQYLQELNKYQQQLQQFLTNPNAVPPAFSNETQVYLQYCYTHYQMYQNLLAYQRTVIGPSTITTTTTTSTQQATTNDNAGVPPPAAQAQQAGANNNNNNEFEQENDLLGILNMLVELFVLCSIIYFYSTFSRFLVVFFIFALLYLHCRGYLSIHRRRRAQAPPAPVVPEQPAANEADHAREEEAEVEPQANEAQNHNENDRQRVQQQAPPPTPPTAAFAENPVTTSRLLLTAISTFFSSLIPERPQRA